MDGDHSEINDTLSVVSKPFGPKPRKPLRSEDSKVNGCLTHNSEELQMKGVSQQRQESAHIHENNASLSNNSDHDKQVTDCSDEELDEQKLLNHSTSKSPNRSRTFSPESISNRINDSRKNKTLENSLKKSPHKRKKLQPSNIEQNTNSPCSRILFFASVPVVLCLAFIINPTIFINTNENKTEHTSNTESVFQDIEDIKTEFYNQDSYIWDEISSGINEVKTRTPKVPSIILLFANETHTMNCLASALACLSTNVLGGDSPLNLNPQDFGNDTGNIIHTLKDYSTKKAVIIRDVLNINAEAIKALHNLCDRINPLIREVIYIITMQTKNYESSQQKMAFVEEQLYHKLSKNIDKDVLMALVTRITDAAIISVQPEPNLRICPTHEEEGCALL